MAEVVKSRLEPGRSRQVPWEKYADGRQWTLRRGTDFEQTPAAARRAWISWAARRKIKTHSWVLDNAIVVEAVQD
jgi:hypothetical protein